MSVNGHACSTRPIHGHCAAMRQKKPGRKTEVHHAIIYISYSWALSRIQTRGQAYRHAYCECRTAMGANTCRHWHRLMHTNKIYILYIHYYERTLHWVSYGLVCCRNNTRPESVHTSQRCGHRSQWQKHRWLIERNGKTQNGKRKRKERKTRLMVKETNSTQWLLIKPCLIALQSSIARARRVCRQWIEIFVWPEIVKKTKDILVSSWFDKSFYSIQI